MRRDDLNTKVNRAMLKALDQHKQTYRQDMKNDVVKIPGLNTYTNSVSIAVGKQGSGKTYTFMKEVIAISRRIPQTHLIILFSKKAYDPTVEATKNLAACPVIVKPYECAEDFVRLLLIAKSKYDVFRRTAIERNIPIEQIPEHIDGCDTLMEILHINDFERNWLNSIIILDDVGNSKLFYNPDSFMNNNLKLCRDQNIIWMLACHGITQLSPAIKTNSAIVYFGKGLSPERLVHVRRQTNSDMEHDEFQDLYRRMNSDDRAHQLVIDNIASTVSIQ
jgi:hypothetical protein